jgi:NADH:ubiquinone oxidoreductase subunit K
MIYVPYVIAIAFSLAGIALAGISTDRHFVVIMLAVELILLASTILLVTFFTYQKSPDPSGIVMLISIWTVAAVEVITVIAFYVYVKARGLDFDVTRLSRMKW